MKKEINNIKKNIIKLDDKDLAMVAGGIKGTPGGNPVKITLP